MHILLLCPRVPFPPHDGGAIAMYDVAAGLARAGHRVTVLAINTPKHHQPADALGHLGPNVRLVTVDVEHARVAGRRREPAVQPHALQCGALCQPGSGGEAAGIAAGRTVDVVQLEGTFVAGTPMLGRQQSAALPGAAAGAARPQRGIHDLGDAGRPARATR